MNKSIYRQQLSRRIRHQNLMLLMLLIPVSLALLLFTGCVEMPSDNPPASGEICPPGTESAAQSERDVSAAENTPAPSVAPAAEEPESTQTETALPRLLDLGATTCRPCIMMAPILEELKAEYAGKLQVDFIDVRVDPAPGQQYGIRAIPTQIFFDPAGNELFRHVGFFSKEDILASWSELGYEFN